MRCPALECGKSGVRVIAGSGVGVYNEIMGSRVSGFSLTGYLALGAVCITLMVSANWLLLLLLAGPLAIGLLLCKICSRDSMFSLLGAGFACGLAVTALCLFLLTIESGEHVILVPDKRLAVQAGMALMTICCFTLHGSYNGFCDRSPVRVPMSMFHY